MQFSDRSRRTAYPQRLPTGKLSVRAAWCPTEPDTADIFRRASSYVDRILRGEKAANLPVQSPIKFELVINMITAKELGLTIHSSFAMLADEVVE